MTIEQLLSGEIDFYDIRTPRDKELEVLKRMLIHSEGIHPGPLLLERHPSEDDVTYQWRLRNYRCITKPIFNKALQALYRIFADTTAEWTTSTNTENFLLEKRFNGLRFDQYHQRLTMKTMIEDPNAWLVTHPRLPIPQNVADKLDVDLSLVRTTHQYHKSNDMIIWCDDPIYDVRQPKGLADSILYHMPKNSYSNYVNIPLDTFYHIVTPEVYAIVYVYKPADSTKIAVDLMDLYDHNTGELLYTILGGKITYEGFYESYFSSFVEFGDEAIKEYSDYQLIRKNCAYPIKEIRAMDCTAQGCKHGMIEDSSGQIIGPCSTCNGTGKIYNFSPSTIIVRPEVEPGLDTPDPTPMITYHTPDVGILENAFKSWMNLLDMSLSSVNLNFVFEAQSGVAKALDRQELYSMIAEIGNNMYDNVIYDSVYRIEKHRERMRAVEPIIVKPSHYNIDTEDRLQEQFQFFSQVKGLEFVKIEIFKRAMQRMHNGNPKKMKEVNILTQIDPYMTYDVTELTILRDSQLISDFDVFVHQRCSTTLQKLLNKKKREREEARKNGRIVEDYLMSTSDEQIVEDLTNELKIEFDEYSENYEANSVFGATVDVETYNATNPKRNLLGEIISEQEDEDSVLENSDTIDLRGELTEDEIKQVREEVQKSMNNKLKTNNLA